MNTLLKHYKFCRCRFSRSLSSVYKFAFQKKKYLLISGLDADFGPTIYRFVVKLCGQNRAVTVVKLLTSQITKE